MYKNRVKNNRIFFEISALLYCELGNPEQENSKYTCYFEFSRSGFPHSQDKRTGISKKNSVVLYPIFIHTLEATFPMNSFSKW